MDAAIKDNAALVTTVLLIKLNSLLILIHLFDIDVVCALYKWNKIRN